MLPINYPFPTNLPQKQWSVCYYIPELHKWKTHKDLDLESTLVLCDMLISLNRYIRVQQYNNNRIFEFKVGMEIATLLKFFYNTLSDRKNAVRHGG